MSKSNNQFGIDYAFPGLCALCHTEICEFNGSDELGRPRIVRLKGNFREATFWLDDGSRMKVSLCDTCDPDDGNLDANQMLDLLESEINGWQAEVDNLIWPEEKKRKHMKEYSKRFFVEREDKHISFTEMEKLKKQKPRPEKLRIKT